eukprot:1362267-Amorphochlora_amoeboformis.AAC.1
MTIGEGQPRDNMGSAGVHRFGFALQLFLAVGLPINLRRSLVQSRHIFSARSKIIRRPLWCRVREEGSLIRTDPENIVQVGWIFSITSDIMQISSDICVYALAIGRERGCRGVPQHAGRRWRRANSGSINGSDNGIRFQRLCC